jgi:hypothetical protein
LEVIPTVSEPALVKSLDALVVRFRPFSMVKLPPSALVVKCARAFVPAPPWSQNREVAPSRRIVAALVTTSLAKPPLLNWKTAWAEAPKTL